jgi:hypothetical protein
MRCLPVVLLLACEKGAPAPAAAPATPLDPESNARIVKEMELRCRRGSGERGKACLVAGSAYEFGEPGIEKDTAHAGQVYGWACKWGTSTVGHDLKWFCSKAQELGGAVPVADAGP